MDEEAWTEYINMDDNVIKTALDVFRKDEAFPAKPKKETTKKDKIASGLFNLPRPYNVSIIRA